MRFAPLKLASGSGRFGTLLDHAVLPAETAAFVDYDGEALPQLTT
jgi:hypothetical protein